MRCLAKDSPMPPPRHCSHGPDHGGSQVKKSEIHMRSNGQRVWLGCLLRNGFSWFTDIDFCPPGLPWPSSFILREPAMVIECPPM